MKTPWDRMWLLAELLDMIAVDVAETGAPWIRSMCLKLARYLRSHVQRRGPQQGQAS